VGEIISDPKITPDTEQSLQYWKNRQDGEMHAFRVDIRYLTRFTLLTSLKKAQLRSAGLGRLEIFRQAEGTNFRVTENEWRLLSGLLAKRYNLPL
jgi:hypothetical protein